MLEIKLGIRPVDYDSDDLYYIDSLTGEKKGCGFQVKATGKRCILRCPECSRENYAGAVSSGYCAWCNWNANLIENKN